MSRCCRYVVLVSLIFSLSGVCRLLAEVVYEVVDLGALGGTNSAARGINNQGQVVGWAQGAEGRTHAFFWEDGVMSDIGQLSGHDSAIAYDINEAGHMAGRSWHSATSAQYRACLWADGTVSNLGVLGVGAYSSAYSINAHDQITGISDTGTVIRAFYWAEGTMHDLGTYNSSGGANSSEGWGINDFGQVVGITHLWNPSAQWRPFLWIDENTNGIRERFEMKILGTLGGLHGCAKAINNIGQVVGHTYIDASVRHAFVINPEGFVWKDPENFGTFTNHYMRDLGGLPGATYSDALAVNEAGVIVGFSDRTGGGNHAIISDGYTMTDLNTLIDTNAGWELTAATDINDSGLIVGYGVVTGATRGFLLRPATPLVRMVRMYTGREGNMDGLTIVWEGSGSNLQYTLEYAEMTNSVWCAVPPSNQWPRTSAYWNTLSNTLPGVVRFRVRAQ